MKRQIRNYIFEDANVNDLLNVYVTVVFGTFLT